MIFENLQKLIKRYPFWFLFILAVVVRLIAFSLVSLPPEFGGDLPTYNRIARSLLAGGGFDGSVYLAPGWPIFLAILYAFFGVNDAAVIGTDILLGGLTVIGVYLLGKYVFSEKVGFIAALVTALWPPLILQTFAYGENIVFYTTLVTFGTYFFLRAFREGRPVYGFFAGALVAIGALTEPIGLYLPVVFLVWVAIVSLRRRRLPSRPAVFAIIIFLVVFALPVSAWAWRNSRVSQAQDIADPAPIISKRVETLVFRRSYWGYFTSPFLPSGWHLIGEGFTEMFLTPYNVWLIDRDTVISYKEIARSIIKGEGQRVSSVFVAKSAITILHWAFLVIAAAGILRARPRAFHLLVFLSVGYVLTAAILYDATFGTAQVRISHFSSFLAPLIPLVIIAAAATLVSTRRQLQ